MRPPRLSIAGLMAFVLILGLGFALLHHPTRMGASLAFGAATISLTFAAVAARVRRGAARLFWLGFAAFGWAYLLIHMGPWFQPQVGPANKRGSDLVRYAPDLPGTILLDLAYSVSVPPATPTPPVGMAGNPNPGPPTLWGKLTTRAPRSVFGLGAPQLVAPYQQTGHAVLSLLAAFVGGFAARSILGRRERAGRPGGEEAA